MKMENIACKNSITNQYTCTRTIHTIYYIISTETTPYCGWPSHTVYSTKRKRQNESADIWRKTVIAECNRNIQLDGSASTKVCAVWKTFLKLLYVIYLAYAFTILMVCVVKWKKKLQTGTEFIFRLSFDSSFAWGAHVAVVDC